MLTLLNTMAKLSLATLGAGLIRCAHCSCRWGVLVLLPRRKGVIALLRAPSVTGSRGRGRGRGKFTWSREHQEAVDPGLGRDGTVLPAEWKGGLLIANAVLGFESLCREPVRSPFR